MSYPTKIDLCDGKYSVIYNFQTGQSECLRYGEKWRELCGDKMVLAMFDRIVELEEGIRQHLAHHENGCTYLSHLVAPNVEFSGTPAALSPEAPLERRVSQQRGCEVSEFKREPRYVVFKIKDILAYLSQSQMDDIEMAGRFIAKGRKNDEKPPFNAVVVEQDWPEFEPTWAAIEARMTANVQSDRLAEDKGKE